MEYKQQIKFLVSMLDLSSKNKAKKNQKKVFYLPSLSLRRFIIRSRAYRSALVFVRIFTVFTISTLLNKRLTVAFVSILRGSLLGRMSSLGIKGGRIHIGILYSNFQTLPTMTSYNI